MRTPYRTVKGNHPGGGVPQEEYDRVRSLLGWLTLPTFYISWVDSNSRWLKSAWYADWYDEQRDTHFAIAIYWEQYSWASRTNMYVEMTEKRSGMDKTHSSNTFRPVGYWTVEITSPFYILNNETVFVLSNWWKLIWNLNTNNTEIISDSTIPEWSIELTWGVRIENINVNRTTWSNAHYEWQIVLK